MAALILDEKCVVYNFNTNFFLANQNITVYNRDPLGKYCFKLYNLIGPSRKSTGLLSISVDTFKTCALCRNNGLSGKYLWRRCVKDETLSGPVLRLHRKLRQRHHHRHLSIFIVYGHHQLLLRTRRRLLD